MSNQPVCGRIPHNAPVFTFGFDDEMYEGWTWTSDVGLPYVCTSVPDQKPTENLTGRLCKGCYRPNVDSDGEIAFFCGTKFFNEGICYTSEEDHDRRIDCFRASELLFLHAAEKGHPRAFLNLGHIYAYDRCEGLYWGHWVSLTVENNRLVWLLSDDLPPYPFEKRAYECYGAAAEAGVAEAYCYLGDMLHDGFGCEPNLEAAFSCYCLAYQQSSDDELTALGIAALRIGLCFEEGEGCEQQFHESCIWYERAVAHLSETVQNGYVSQRGRLQYAQAGLARVRQELSGQY